MAENKSYKYFFKNYGIFIAIIFVIFAILIYSVIISKKSWTDNLKVSVQKVLDESEENHWSMGNAIPINNPFALNGACYEVRNRDSGEMYKAVILRVATFYGPQAGVFLCDSENNVTFAGYSSLHGRISQQLMNNKGDLRLEYWQKKIPEIIKQ